MNEQTAKACISSCIFFANPPGMDMRGSFQVLVLLMLVSSGHAFAQGVSTASEAQGGALVQGEEGVRDTKDYVAVTLHDMELTDQD